MYQSDYSPKGDKIVKLFPVLSAEEKIRIEYHHQIDDLRKALEVMNSINNVPNRQVSHFFNEDSHKLLNQAIASLEAFLSTQCPF
jgi:hypothetical protein